MDLFLSGRTGERRHLDGHNRSEPRVEIALEEAAWRSC
jgi:hypothetical protein